MPSEAFHHFLQSATYTVNPYSSSKRSTTEKKTRKLRITNIISTYEKKISNIQIKNAVDNKRVFFLNIYLIFCQQYTILHNTQYYTVHNHQKYKFTLFSVHCSVCRLDSRRRDEMSSLSSALTKSFLYLINSTSKLSTDLNKALDFRF